MRWLLVFLAACGTDGHGPIAEGISAPMGEPIPTATPEQLASFERGIDMMNHRFDRSSGLGPGFNVTFCASCHEKPAVGGGAPLYRNFTLHGVETADGAVLLDVAGSAGNHSGVVRLYHYDKLPELMPTDPDGMDEWCNDDVHSPTARPPIDERANVFAQRNARPFFGAGLLAELSDDVILANADPDDLDGDGISGRPNYEDGLIGRFGVKAQTTSIEGFVRGPLNNHLGITSDPLTEELRALLPVDSSSGPMARMVDSVRSILGFAQAVAPSAPIVDDDCVQDPELAPQELFDIVAATMLMAAPEIEVLTEQGERGRDVFDDIGCASCHTPRLEGPRGPLPVYSDLLLHDMGPELADGLQFGNATGSEFKTQPLWGVYATAPYLHDGRAKTMADAIEMHGGEGEASRDAWLALTIEEQDDLLEFLKSLGGRDQRSHGLIPPQEPTPAVGELGGPIPGLTPEQLNQFESGRDTFDMDFHEPDGLGLPGFNGDSCRACHFEPVVGGAGPRGVNVTREGTWDGTDFTAPAAGDMLHRLWMGENVVPKKASSNYVELRSTPSLLGMGLVEGIAEADILANEDPMDLDSDGISGRAHRLPNGQLGRFGWKANVPSLIEFTRDAFTNELGMTVPEIDGLEFGLTEDSDSVFDPELTVHKQDFLTAYMRFLGAPPASEAPAGGQDMFEQIGCATCHVPEFQGEAGPVRLFSDLLLHEILDAGSPGIPTGDAGALEFRTAPLWGIRDTAPYMHDGRADTLHDAIEAHAGEAGGSRTAYRALTLAEQELVLEFLQSL